MPEQEKIVNVLVEDEMKKSYLGYAMSVIVGRALPDIRDGLKPVHRRILFAMNEMGMQHNKPFKKSARIVGEVLGKFHPHGDVAVYDSLVRMAQEFSLRYTLVDGQGNFGSVDGDNAAAMRYCITGDSLILTDIGILPIKNISDKEESKINMKILSYNGKNNSASKFFNSGKHNILWLKTRLGYNLKGSYNHPLMCWTYKNNFPKIEWKLFENIKKKDIIVLNRNHSLFSKKSLNLKRYSPKTGFKNNIKLPQEMNNNLAFLLGALVSEGSFHNNRILFNNKDKEFYNKVKSIILSQFKGVQLYERNIKGNCKELCIYEQKAVIFLKNIGLNQVKSDQKEIPFSVLTSTKENIAYFLNALFEGDGSVKYKTDKRHSGKSIELTYNSKSITLIDQLKIVLLNFGIVTTNPYRDKRNGCYKLIISGHNSIKNFKNETNFFSKRKRRILSNISSMNHYRMSKTDSIPYINEYLRKKYKKGFIIKNNFDRYNNLEKNYNKLIKIIDSKDKQLIDFILKNKYLFNEVSEIRKLSKKEEVYSVRVDSNCHSFIANGFINHNTEARLKKLSEELLKDIDKETVKFVPNFDGSLQEPVVLPCKFPNLLVNGSSGIAVGMATNIPPHNLKEVCDASIALIDNQNMTVQELLTHVQGPDFPTGASIVGKNSLKEVYETGRGKFLVRAKTNFEGNKIIVTEIPYMANKSLLIEQIADLVRNKAIGDISDIRDESDRDGIRIVIILKKDADANIVLNQLLLHSNLQVTFGSILIALKDNVPKVFNLKQLLSAFIEHRKQIVTNRTKYDLRLAEERTHVLEGLIVAIKNIDDIVPKIKSSKDAEAARDMLIQDYSLTEIQAKAILDMKLQRLASLEQQKILDEHKQLLENIKEYGSILASEQKVLNIIKSELSYIKENYSDKRKTEIIEHKEELVTESIVKPEEVVVTITSNGYIKRLPVDTYRAQSRGGKGVKAASVKEEDFIKELFICNSHDYLLFFTNKGKVHWIKVYELPEASRQAAGKAVINLLNLSQEEKVQTAIPVKEFTNQYLIFATKNGIVKKTSLEEYSNPRKGGIIAIILDENDSLIDVLKTSGNDEIIIATKNGMAVKFNEQDVRPAGRNARGVIGIRLKDDDSVIGMVSPKPNEALLTVTENGYGKRTLIGEYREISRGGSGVKNFSITDKTGQVINIESVSESNDIILITKNGTAIRISAKDISLIGRATQGVRVIRLEENDKLISIAKIAMEKNGSNEHANQ